MKLTPYLIIPSICWMLLSAAFNAGADTTSSPLPPSVHTTTPSWAQGYNFSSGYTWLDETEYLPEIAADSYIWQERNFQVQLSKSIGTGRLGFGYIDGTIKQKNEIYNDTDFALTRKAPFALLDWRFSEKLQTRVRVRYEEYSDDGRAGFYQLGSDENLWTGYAMVSYVESRWWVNVSHSRERDPEPIYDAANDRVALDISAQALSGLTFGWLWSPQWEAAAAVYYEAYGSDRPDQFNYTVQVTHKPTWLPQLQAALGVGYYTEEVDTLINLTLNYHKQLYKDLSMQVEYQLEYSDDEQSLLNQGRLLLSYALTSQFSVTASTEYGKESGDDQDDSLFVVASVDYRF
ncbi:MAG: hypothetical protein RBR22_08965 [Desulfuromonas sp.]|nr:hypothetical protein [Desulfuromonas sp.]